MKRIGLISLALLLASCGDGFTQPETFLRVEIGPGLATASITVQGTVVSMVAGEYGVIARSDDASGTQYEFRVSADTGGKIPEVGAFVVFTVDLEDSWEKSAQDE